MSTFQGTLTDVRTRDELLLLLIRGLRDKAALTASDWKRIREIEEALR